MAAETLSGGKGLPRRRLADGIIGGSLRGRGGFILRSHMFRQHVVTVDPLQPTCLGILDREAKHHDDGPVHLSSNHMGVPADARPSARARVRWSLRRAPSFETGEGWMINSSNLCVLLFACALVLGRIFLQDRGAEDKREHHEL